MLLYLGQDGCMRANFFSGRESDGGVITIYDLARRGQASQIKFIERLTAKSSAEGLSPMSLRFFDTCSLGQRYEYLSYNVSNRRIHTNSGQHN